MTETLNFKIPPTLLRLGTDDVEQLIIIGLDRDVTRDDIQSLMDLRYPNRKRAANSMVRLVIPLDLRTFNRELECIRDKGIKSHYKMSIQSEFSRGIATLRVFGD